MVPSLLYVSHRTPPASGAAREFDEMVNRAVQRNRAMNITGALLSTRLHFAQYLEGPRVALTELMNSIGKDPLHTGLIIFSPRQMPSRRFWEWSLATSKASAFVAKKVRLLLDRSYEDEDLAPILLLMRVLIDEQAAKNSREAHDSPWSSAEAHRSSQNVNHDATSYGVDVMRDIAPSIGASPMDSGTQDIVEAVKLMRRALERLDSSGADIAAAHLDLAIASALPLIEENTSQGSQK